MMLITKSMTYKLFLSLLLLSVFFPDCSQASMPDELQSEIEARQQQLTKHQVTIERLSRQERETYSKVAQVEDRLNEISERLASQENELESIVSREAETARNYRELSEEMSETRKELAGLLENIWPIFLESQGKGLAEIMQWSDLDREMTWLRAIYSEAEKAYSRLQAQSAELASNLIRLQMMKDDYQANLAQVNTTKNQLLDKKLTFLRELQEIRAKRLAGEEMISEIIDVIDSLNYKLSTTTHRKFESFKGHLAWPATGRLVSYFSPSDSPPHNGLSIALEENSPVKAISWGKIVHNDTLRGFGRVVIIFHGDNYYSLYAYLSDSNYAIGQEVEKGEIIGRAGYYPQINSHGMYFELRFKQKPINPVSWLTQL